MAINVPLNAQFQNGPQAASQLQRQLQSALNSLRINVGGSGARGLNSLSQPLGRLTGQANEFTKSLDAANARVFAFGAAVGVVNTISNAFKGLVKSTIEVEKAITEITVVGEQFSGKTKELSQGIFAVAKTTGQSFDVAAKAALEFSRQGLGLEETLKRTQDALILTRLTGLDATKAVDGLTSSVNAFAKAGVTSTEILNKLAAVDQAFAVSSADLIEGFNRTASVAQNAGVSIDELVGLITALQQQTARGGPVIGNALKTIFTRLGETTTIKKLKDLGITVQDLSGQVLPARQILQNLANDVQGLGKVVKNGLFKDVAGAFQINQLVSLVGDLADKNSIAAAATQKSAGATREAYTANEKLNQTLDSIINKTVLAGKELGSIVGELGLTDSFKGILNGLSSFVEEVNKTLQGDSVGSNFAKGIVKGIGAVLTGPGLAIFGAVIGKLLLDLTKFASQGFKTFFGIGKAAAEQKQIQDSIVETLLRNEGVANAILNVQGGQNAQGLKFLNILNEQAAAMATIQKAAGGIAATVYAGGYRATSAGLQKKSDTGITPDFTSSAISQAIGSQLQSGVSAAQNNAGSKPTGTSSGTSVGNASSVLAASSASQALLTASDGSPAVVGKSFSDVAGKILLLQSAVTFATGAFQESENSLVKFAQEAASAAANLTSLVFLGQQINQANPVSSFGKFFKNLGLAGIGFAAISEGFKLANFAVKEFSGENQKAALASAKLADSSNKLSIRFDELSQTRQSEISRKSSELLGSKGYEGFFNGVANLFREKKIGGGEIGEDPAVKKALNDLFAQGATTTQIGKILDDIKKSRVTTYTTYDRRSDKSYQVQAQEEVRLSDIREGLNKELASGLGKTLSDQFQTFKSKISVIDLGAKGGRDKALQAAAESYGAKNFASLNESQKQLVLAELDTRDKIVKKRQEEVKEERNQALGEILNIELAKQKLNVLVEQKKLSVDLATNLATQQYRFQLEALDVSEAYSNELQKQIKLREIEGEQAKGNLDIITAVIDKLSSLPSGSALGVSADKYSQIEKELKSKTISTPKDLESAIGSIGQQLELSPTQIANTTKFFVEQFKLVQNKADAEKRAANNATDFNKRVIEAKTNLQLSRNWTDKIASDLERAADVKFSFAEIGIGATQNQAAILRARASASTNTLQRLALESGAIGKDVFANQQSRQASEAKYQSDRQAKVLQLQQAITERETGRSKFSTGIINQKAFNDLVSAASNAQAALDKLDNQQAVARQNFDKTNQELEIQAKALRNVVGAADALENALYQFNIGAGERIGTAQLDALGATDLETFAKSRIKSGVETKAQNQDLDYKDYYQFVQETTKQRELQFDKAVAESQTRRRELEYELKYTQEIIDLKNKGASEQELISARNRQILEQRSGTRGLQKGFDAIQDRINNYKTTLGEEIPNLFSQNLAQGLNDAISGAKDLKSALTDAASSFFQAITQKNIANLADLVTSGFSGLFGASQKGAQGFASGGMIKGGSGTKDDVPAMLMGGEYVMNKKAVSRYGKGFLDDLNNGRMRGYATGGLVDPQTYPTQTGAGGFAVPGDYGQGAITGKTNLLAFASQTYTSGGNDYSGGFGLGGATVSLEGESARLSAFGRENSPMFDRVQQAKSDAFQVYLSQLQQEKQYTDLLDQIAQEKKARQKQLQASLITAAVSSFANYAGNAVKVGAINASAAGGSKFLGAFSGQSGKGGIFNLFSGNGTTLTNAAKALQFSKIAPLISSRATGGLISGGSNIRDDVPAMLTGGEFVLNNRATQRIGLQNLNKLNSGGDSSNSNSADATQALVAKLDELIQVTQNSAHDSVVVNVSAGDTSGQTTDNSSSTQQDLGKKIRQAVLDVIAQEKRLGGSLEKAR